MEDKRTFVAIGLCLLVLVGWSYLSELMGWTPPPAPRTEQAATAPAPSQAPLPNTPVMPKFQPSAGKDVRVETPLYTAVFYSGGGVLRSFELKHYAETMDPNSPPVNLVSQAAAASAPMGLLVNGKPSWSVGEWSYEGGDLNVPAGQNASITFTALVDGMRVSRVLSFTADTYLITETVLLRSVDDNTKPARLGFSVGATPFSVGSDYNLTRIALSDSGSFNEQTDGEDLASQGYTVTGNLLWAGVMNNYFMTMMAPVESANLTLKARVENGVWRVGLDRPEMLVSSSETPITTAWWFGPKDRNALMDAPNDLRGAVNFGFFSVIARPLLIVLEFFNSYVHNWGVSILLLTLCIRIVFWPLSQKSYKSMDKMKKMQPMMAALKEKYGDNKEQLNREVMQLYRTYGVNPASGCLPIVVQIPVFIGLYQALLNSIELRHAAFITHVPFTNILWLADLSAKDPFYVTPLLMGLSMFVQQKLSPPVGDPTQQKVMMFLPLIFTVMFLNFPAGLVIYWLCNNVLSIGQQWWQLRKA